MLWVTYRFVPECLAAGMGVSSGEREGEVTGGHGLHRLLLLVAVFLTQAGNTADCSCFSETNEGPLRGCVAAQVVTSQTGSLSADCSSPCGTCTTNQNQVSLRPHVSHHFGVHASRTLV